MPDLRRRVVEPELLDIGVPEDEARRSLADLRFVNRFMGGRRALLGAVLPLLPRGPARLLDVGCGSADLPHALRGHRPDLCAVGLDLKLTHLRVAPESILGVVGDLRRPPFVPLSFDVVTASLVLHHFPTGELPELLRALHALARSALVVNDLRRARVPYAFARAFFPLLLSSRVSVLDGLASLRAAFTESELREALRAAGLRGAKLSRAFPYRLLAIVPGQP